jgi:7-carboxy-7-deazaguanine synthase (Cx14CxxC type)
MYKIKEIYYTIQGEGYHAGQAAIFCRFSGCNLWSGREADRHKAICKFCDTDFWGTDGRNGGKYDADELVQACLKLWPKKTVNAFVVCTGGEPLLQMDQTLVESFHKAGFYVAIETNGTQDVPPGIDWICMSPKANTKLVLKKANELKLVYPQDGLSPTDFEQFAFDHFYLQPMDSKEKDFNTRASIDYCKKNPKWKLSIQTHKYLGID